MIRSKRFAVRSALLLAIGAGLCAHDLWLIPPAPVAAPGTPQVIEVAVGMDFPHSESAAHPSRLHLAAQGPRTKLACEVEQRTEEKRTLVRCTPEESGVHVVTCRTEPRVLSMKADEFNSYLLHDGLPQVLSARMERGELARDAVERYRKCAKALFEVGDAGPRELATQALGLELEVVCEKDPLRAAVGEALPVRVLLRGAGVANANLCWDHPGNGALFSGQCWTDAEGRALVPIAKSGLMTLRLIHMERPQAADHEWDSLWSSLTFRVR
ncbi:MAG: DUF4198 domain-containing protein [Planctomycetes bacterium]|nr:DUF4198 domain-containing protein [Planctomycetota bacterium]